MDLRKHQGKAEQPRRAAVKILQCNNELCQYELRQVVRTITSVSRRALSHSSLGVRGRLCANPKPETLNRMATLSLSPSPNGS